MSDPRRYKRPESVLIVVHTPDLECLLLERVKPAAFWQSVTGSLRWDEAPAQAAARELSEETGLDPLRLEDARVTRRFAIAPEWRARYAPGVTENIEHRWYLSVPSAVPIVLNAAEHNAYQWLSLDDAIARVSSWTNREALEALRAR